MKNLLETLTRKVQDLDLVVSSHKDQSFLEGARWLLEQVQAELKEEIR